MRPYGVQSPVSYSRPTVVVSSIAIDEYAACRPEIRRQVRHVTPPSSLRRIAIAMRPSGCSGPAYSSGPPGTWRRLPCTTGVTIVPCTRYADCNVLPPSADQASPRVPAVVPPWSRQLKYRRPSGSSATVVSFSLRAPVGLDEVKEICQVWPPSSEISPWPPRYFASAPVSVLPAAGVREWLAGMTSRPACGPWVTAVPHPGPVAYQRIHDVLTLAVMSTGVVQVAPLSAERWTDTCRVARPFRMAVSVASAALPHDRSTRSPEAGSVTTVGLPAVSAPWAVTTCCGDQLVPPSVERRHTMSMSPLSPPPFLRPSANAISVPSGARVSAGMR